MSSNPAQTAPSPAQSGIGFETGPMVIEHGRDRLLALVERQLTNLFEYDPCADAGPLQTALEVTLNRVSHCFSRIVLKRYQQDGAARFSPFHSGQYCIFLYYLSHTLARQGAAGLADRVYYLNRALNGVDLFHQVDLPEVFCVEHPLASVIGRARKSGAAHG